MDESLRLLCPNLRKISKNHMKKTFIKQKVFFQTISIVEQKNYF